MELGKMSERKAEEFANDILLNMNHTRQFLPVSTRFKVTRKGGVLIMEAGDPRALLPELTHAISVEWGGPFTLPAGMITVQCLAEEDHPMWSDEYGLTRMTVDFGFQVAE